jgi:TetR/AcrR family transcriptional repressor of nem operon
MPKRYGFAAYRLSHPPPESANWPLLTNQLTINYDAAMGRPREFDEDEVIAEALQTFWKQGYGATSIPDLMEATQLERGSIYKAFEDKHSLFERAFDNYLSAGRAKMAQILGSDAPPISRLQAFFAQVVAGCSGAEGGPGCLAVNTMVELAPSDAAVRDRLVRHWKVVERMLEQTLRDGQSEGEIRKDVSAKDLARLVVKLIAGIAVFSRQGSPTDATQTIIQLLSRVR